jgi:hypothetical protein
VAQNNLTRQVAYDNPAALARLAFQYIANSAGANAATGNKFVAWTKVVVWGVTFATTTPGTSTYTVAGTATSPATQAYARHVSNTNTTGTAVTLATDTVGPFTIGGTSTAGSNVSVGGTSGGLAGGYQGPYALNTLGGTNTSQVWGTTTYVSGTATGAQVQSGYQGLQPGLGGLPMNEGETLDFVLGTDATAVIVPILQYSVLPVNGNLVA